GRWPGNADVDRDVLVSRRTAIQYHAQAIAVPDYIHAPNIRLWDSYPGLRIHRGFPFLKLITSCNSQEVINCGHYRDFISWRIQATKSLATVKSCSFASMTPFRICSNARSNFSSG